MKKLKRTLACLLAVVLLAALVLGLLVRAWSMGAV